MNPQSGFGTRVMTNKFATTHLLIHFVDLELRWGNLFSHIFANPQSGLANGLWQINLPQPIC
jgi:hypothetical protein